MAEAILSDLATKILEGFGSLLVQEIKLASGVRKELRKLEESLSQIKAILSDAEKKGAMNDVVKDWLRKLKDVAYDAEDVLDDFATEVLRQKVELPNNNIVVKQVRRCFSRANPLIFRLKMAHRIKDIIERLDRFQKDNLYSTFQSLPENVDRDIYDEDRRHTDPYVIESVLGRDQDRENLVQLLLSSGGGNSSDEDENVMVIPIIGIGGLGKTTLAQYVYNDERVKKHFESQMWVCVSFDFDVVKLTKKILESLINVKCDDLGENQAKSKLIEKLLGKRYLLVLDDVWNDHPGKWENLRKLLIGGARGSMILVTTRSEEVASIMQPIKVFYHLKVLDENDCESLFNERAFGRKGKEANHPELAEIGKGIVKKCGGVPLAAKALGSLLCFKRDKKDWLDVLNTEIWNLAGEREILPALRISYNQLPSHLKQCFAYCSLFPQDHEIDVDDLIQQWMAHGFISSSSSTTHPPRSSSSSGGSNSNASLEDIGNRYFRELLWRSFFQEVEEDEYGNIWRCKMHDLVHNLARWVAGLEWSEVVLDSSSSFGSGSRGNIGSTTLPSIASDGVRHMVFHGNDQVLIPLDKPQKLRTLYYKSAISAGLIISSLRGLRVLKLSLLGMRNVPSSIGHLEQLRYLDLSWNPFKALPNSICRLYNLQTLRLEVWDHFLWPKDMTKMVSLRHLVLGNYQHMEYMPRGLGQLTSLRTLGQFVVEDPNNTTTRRRRRRSRKISGGLGELHGLNQLRGSLSIQGLGNVRDASDAEKANLKGKSELRSLEFSFWTSILNSNTNREDEQVLENLEPHPSLKELTINWYEGVKMPRWMIIPSINSSQQLLSNLVKLDIYNCSNLKCLPLIGEFPCLKTLSVSSLHALESICNKVVVRGGGGEALLSLFPSLQDLYLGILPNLKRWTINPYSSSSIEATTTVEEEDEEAQHNNNNQFHFLSSMFPRLTHLSLLDCPKLTRVPVLPVAGIQHLTSLQKLTIVGLESLVSLPDCPAPATLEELEIINCPSLVRLPDRFFENLTLLSEFRIKECSSMELTSLPEGIQRLTALKQLEIGECRGLTLPEGIGNLASLQLLQIHGCTNLMYLPEGIQHLTALETLSIQGCPGLRALPDGLGNVSSLQELDFDNCPNLMSLPEGIQHLTALKMLSIKGCSSLNTLPKDLGSSLIALEELSISELNCINELPESLGNLTALERLSISKLDGINQLPESLGNLTALKGLSISRLNGINQLPESLGNLTSLKELDINDFPNLNSLPKGIQHLNALKALKIKSCPGLKTLPEGLGSLSSLEKLYIEDCSNLSSLPEVLQHLTALKELRIKSCPGLKTLPEVFGSLLSLGKLYIEDCSNLSSLLEVLQHLTALKELRIKSCPGLKTLPEVFGSLSSLEKLYIEDCSNLSSLPKGFHHLTALEDMSIKNCSGLRALPHGLRNLEARGLLKISDCPNLSLNRDFPSCRPRRFRMV